MKNPYMHRLNETFYFYIINIVILLHPLQVSPAHTLNVDFKEGREAVYLLNTIQFFTESPYLAL